MIRQGKSLLLNITLTCCEHICNIWSNYCNIVDTYDLVVGLGALIPNHINEDAFQEMIRIIRPGNKISDPKNYILPDMIFQKVESLSVCRQSEPSFGVFPNYFLVNNC